MAAQCKPPTTESQLVKLEKSQTSLSQRWMYRLAPALRCRPWDVLPEAAEMSPAEEIRALWPQLTAEERVAFAVELSHSLPPDLASGVSDPPPKNDNETDAAADPFSGVEAKLVDLVWEADGRVVLTVFKSARDNAIIVPVVTDRPAAPVKSQKKDG